MKFIPLACAALFAVATMGVHAQNDRNVSDGPMKSYGKEFKPDGVIGTTEFEKRMADKETMEAKLACEIVTSCKMKGCWMDVKLSEGRTMKVRFADYGFFVPKEGLEGKSAILMGTATRETIDVATLRHYAEDAGKSKEEVAAITEPETTITFLADGVMINE